MSDFLIYFDTIKRIKPFKLEIYYSDIMDWCITIYQNGDRIIGVQDCDKEFVFAKAHVKLKEWMVNNLGSY